MALSEKATEEKKVESKTTLPKTITPPITPLVKKASMIKVDYAQTNPPAKLK